MAFFPPLKIHLSLPTSHSHAHTHIYAIADYIKCVTLSSLRACANAIPLITFHWWANLAVSFSIYDQTEKHIILLLPKISFSLFFAILSYARILNPQRSRREEGIHICKDQRRPFTYDLPIITSRSSTYYRHTVMIVCRRIHLMTSWYFTNIPIHVRIT